jgi:tRNA pseudouridine13 synthase
VLPDWRRAWGGPVLTGQLKSLPEDFRVTELADFDFDDSGEHDWLWIEKIDVNTAWLARRLAEFAAVPPKDVGYAGMKDRHAVTCQWFSVRRPGGDKADWANLQLPGVRVLERRRHSRKLRRGAHKANRFELRLRHCDGDAEPMLARIAAHGVPNYFGEQRFGHDGRNVAMAQSLFAGRRLRRDKRSLALSAARGFLFNEILDRRIAAGTWNRLLPGDVANLDGSNSVFDVDTVDEIIAERATLLDLHASGALWGRGGDAVGSRLLSDEQAAVAAHTELHAGLERHCVAGRRALRMRVRELRWESDGDTLRLEFSLGRGSFATAVLRELVSYVVPDALPVPGSASST